MASAVSQVSSACIELRCGCTEFVPNIFQKNICKECYHVLSKHGGAQNVVQPSKSKEGRPVVTSFVEEGKSNSPAIQRKEPKQYPPNIKTISEKFRKFGVEKSPEPSKPPDWTLGIVDHQIEPKKTLEAKPVENNSAAPPTVVESLEIPQQEEKQQEASENILPEPTIRLEVQIDKTETKNEVSPPLVPLKNPMHHHFVATRSATTAAESGNAGKKALLAQLQPNRVSTNFAIDLPRRKKSVGENKIPPPTSSLPAPPTAPLPPTTLPTPESTENSLKLARKPIPPTGTSETVKKGTLQTNSKRHAIRHRPSEGYSTLFLSEVKSPAKETKLRKLEDSLRIDPRKPGSYKKRSSTVSAHRSPFKTKDDLATNTMPKQMEPAKRRRSSLPLSEKLKDIGIEVPPVTLNISLHEPSKEVRTIEVKVEEIDNTTVASLLHSLSQELTTMQSSLETPQQEQDLGSPFTSPRSEHKKKNIFRRVGNFTFGKTKKNDNATYVAASPLSPRNKLARIKDFALYWPAKDEWLDPNNEISSYKFPENSVLEFKRRVRDFKLRMQYEVKLFFPQYGWTKISSFSPSTTTVAQIRLHVIDWLHSDSLWIDLPETERDDVSLSLFGIYLNGNHLEDETKVISTYYLKQKDTLEIRQNPGYTVEVTSNNHEKTFLVHLLPSCTFQDLINQICIIDHNRDSDAFEVELNSPLGRLDSNTLSHEFSRALLRTGERFSVFSLSGKSWKILVSRVPKDSQTITESRIPSNILLEGERIMESTITEHVTIFYRVRGQKAVIKYSGTLMVTNYRIMLERKFQGKDASDDWIEIPITSVSSIDRVKSKDKELRKHCLDIFCKCIRKVTIGFVDSEKRNQNYKLLNDIITKHEQNQLFSYFYRNEFGRKGDERPGWDIYDAKTEFARMGVFSSTEQRFGWRLTNLNLNYDLCKSYPNVLVVPATISDETVANAISFRTKNRLPALVWLHPITGVSLCRSSQPKVGLQRNTSKDDQAFLYEISMQGTMNQSESGKTRQLHVFDARPMKAAVGNTVMGAGYESDTTGYGFCHSHFLNIDNIHAVRESFNKLHDLCISIVEEDSDTFSHWLQHLDATNWFYLLSRILVGAKRIAELLMDDNELSPVLIHCSDGWDRTSQLSALSQLLVDPFYRTYTGFQILIAKDWLSFGHQIAFRMGHNYGSKEEAEQQAPIFLQFLDCVHQLTVQFPTSFEFSESILGFLHEEVINCKFGTFLMNCERERKEANLPYRTRSVWEYLHEHRDEFINPFYVGTMKPVDYIAPNCEIPNLRLWDSYFFKYLDLSDPPLLAMERRMKEIQAELDALKAQKISPS